jgi:hypothetical protein
MTIFFFFTGLYRFSGFFFFSFFCSNFEFFFLIQKIWIGSGQVSGANSSWNRGSDAIRADVARAV